MYWWEWAKLAIDLLKSLAWPLTVIALACLFRADIKQLASRIIQASTTGLVLAAPGQTAPPDISLASAEIGPTADNKAREPNALPDTNSIPRSISDLKSSIPSDQLEPMYHLARQALPADVADDCERTKEFLLYALASVSLQLIQERNYRNIFGSQLSLLLQSNNPTGVDVTFARQLYADTAAAHPKEYANFSFDNWINFPVSADLLHFNPLGRYEITARGRGLLKYILDMRLSPNKPF